MDTNTLILLAVVVIAIAVVAVLIARSRRTQKLQSHFGPEYSRTVDEVGGRRRAEAELKEREKRVQSFSIKPLSPEDRDRFRASWSAVQARFVDEPRGSVSQADELLGQVMSARGYPVADFDQRSADLSV